MENTTNIEPVSSVSLERFGEIVKRELAAKGFVVGRFKNRDYKIFWRELNEFPNSLVSKVVFRVCEAIAPIAKEYKYFTEFQPETIAAAIWELLTYQTETSEISGFVDDESLINFGKSNTLAWIRQLPESYEDTDLSALLSSRDIRSASDELMYMNIALDSLRVVAIDIRVKICTEEQYEQYSPSNAADEDYDEDEGEDESDEDCPDDYCDCDDCCDCEDCGEDSQDIPEKLDED